MCITISDLIWNQYKLSTSTHCTLQSMLACLESVQLQFSLLFTYVCSSIPSHPFCSEMFAHLVSAIQLLQGQGVLEQPDDGRAILRPSRCEGHLRSRRHWVLVDPGTRATSTTGSSQGLGSDEHRSMWQMMLWPVEWLWMSINPPKSAEIYDFTSCKGNVQEHDR